MKKMVCEMCGGTDLIKTDGVFVCQSCGCKYTPEEAKSMMVEVAGTVDVSGSTVKVDTNERLANLYEIARRSRDNGDNEAAANYYNTILIDDPQSWEATFYSVYCRALECRIIQIASAAEAIDHSLGSVFTLMKKCLSEDEQLQALKEVELKCVVAAQTFYSNAKKHYIDIPLSLKADSTEYSQELFDRSYASRDLLLHFGDKVESLFNDETYTKEVSVDAWKEGVKIDKDLVAYLSSKRVDVSGIKGVIVTYQNKIRKRDSSYQDDEARKERREKQRQKIDSIEADIKKLDKDIQATADGTKGKEPIGQFLIPGFVFLAIVACNIYLTYVVEHDEVTFFWGFLYFILVISGVMLILIGISNAKNNHKNKPKTVEEIRKATTDREKTLEQLKNQREQLKKRKERLEKDLNNM